MKLAPIFALILIAGCGGAKEPITGAWKGQVKLPDNLKNNAQAQAATKETINLNLGEDGKFTMGEGMQAISGKWTQSGSQLTLTMEVVAGKPVAEAKKELEKIQPGASKPLDEPLRATVAEDGKSISMQPSSGNQGTVEFTR